MSQPETEIPSETVVSTPEPPTRIAHGAGRDGEACACPKCGLYRWYPPLLLLSTIMAGVFCWMYVTKPVFLAPAQHAAPGAVQPAIKDNEPTPGMQSGEPQTAEVERALDPALAPSIMNRPEESPVVSIAGLGELEPLETPAGERGSLFVPMTEEESQDFGVPEQSPPLDELIAEEAGEVVVEELATYLEYPGTPGVGEEVALGALAVSFAARQPVAPLGPSFMTDFLVADHNQALAADLLSAEEQALHWINQLTE